MNSILAAFKGVVEASPDKIAFVSLEGTEEKSVSYGVLNNIIQCKATQLLKVEGDAPVLLLYNDTVDFITTFLACQSIGIICIPMFYPNNKRHFGRLTGIIENSGCTTVLTSEDNRVKIEAGLHQVTAAVQVVALQNNIPTERELQVKTNSVAFIQYTSGSTSAPKGVVVSQENLMHNQKMIQENFGCNEGSIILSWLPFYHDMGLIGSLLHTIFSGCTCVVMKPSAVVKNPADWLLAVQKYKVTHTGGPNFIYDMCNSISEEQIAGIDLSSVEVIYNGSEPIKASTVTQFVAKFGAHSLKKEAYRTCYGLAEATLIVTGGVPNITNEAVTSGATVSEMEIIFFDNDTKKVNAKQGEICIHGDSVTSGYWKADSSAYFLEHEQKKFFKTGDVGCWMNDQLCVNGRLKEMLIINGQNIFPYDIEIAISDLHAAIVENGVSIAEEDGRIFLFAEIDRAFVRSDDQFFKELKNSIDKELIDTVGIESERIVFVTPRALPRTSSGKIRRKEMRTIWLAGELSVIGSAHTEIDLAPFDSTSFDWSKDSVEQYLVDLVGRKLRVSDKSIILKSSLFDLGLSSIKAVELVNTISKDLEVELDLEQVFELNKVNKVAEHILDVRWLSSATEQDTEIEL